MTGHGRLVRRYEALNVGPSEQTYQSDRMEILKGARAMIDQLDMGEEYEPTIYDVVILAEFIAGDKGGITP
jgi:hypothetical protein